MTVTIQSSTGIAKNVAGVVQVTALSSAAGSSDPVTIQRGGSTSRSDVTIAISGNDGSYAYGVLGLSTTTPTSSRIVHVARR